MEKVASSIAHVIVHCKEDDIFWDKGNMISTDPKKEWKNVYDDLKSIDQYSDKEIIKLISMVKQQLEAYLDNIFIGFKFKLLKHQFYKYFFQIRCTYARRDKEKEIVHKNYLLQNNEPYFMIVAKVPIVGLEDLV